MLRESAFFGAYILQGRTSALSEVGDGKGILGFYAELDRVRDRAAEVRAMGFGWTALNATAIFQAGARSVDAMVDILGRAHEAIRTGGRRVAFAGARPAPVASGEVA